MASFKSSPSSSSSVGRWTHEEDKFGRETDRVNKWRKALVAAAGLSGWHIKETGSVSNISVGANLPRSVASITYRHL
ncbi:hypothetical protein L2E82_36119 [Cichorium intybus]|uniref:Uncharacterized protein n=1 Tax=Cichorium intybus TaxID=13427 RepID=A0ACB9BQS0_CICIN|nr:hypothetical protein L2E82_36119 [Cichorium intybus]